MGIKISKTNPTSVWVVLHRFKGSIVGAEQRVFTSKKDGEDFIMWCFGNDSALDYKDSFYLREVVIDESESERQLEVR